ncbi:MFS transporter [Reinekea marinisedimentorum]|uniref:Cyanate permease n=1 Tax=Reinekea marinisedimentorum TaxID=230495 RepID=A0A4V2UJQ6_9GAMM|nr:MFS transporter [Reinekea marinisedimentorum]TCS40829.1 cyanate permease [Reinekea marinisedimentorum]
MNDQKLRENFLLLVAFVMPIAFSSWLALLNNFAIDAAGFTGREIGILQSLREVPGFLSFAAVFVLLFLHEQRFAVISLLLLGLGVFLTGFFPSVLGLYVTTVIMSIGFHYFETINQSLTLQWLPKEHTAEFMGRVLSVKAVAAILSFGGVWLAIDYFELAYVYVYAIFGGLTLVAVVYMALRYPLFAAKAPQQKKLILRKRYWLFYWLTFLSGARRQIFVVFAGFLMVEKFGYSAGQIALLLLINHFFNMLFAKKIGAWIGHIGERKALTIEYIGLVLVFAGYAIVENAWAAAGLYVVDHLFFAFAIAIKTYFQKIADPGDMASTAGVSFTINHIAAVVLPVVLGLVWLVSPAAVFYLGAVIAALSLASSQLIPSVPAPGEHVRWQSGKSVNVT